MSHRLDRGMEMRYCEACKAEIPDGYDECPFCGVPAPEEDTVEFVEESASIMASVERQLEEDE